MGDAVTNGLRALGSLFEVLGDALLPNRGEDVPSEPHGFEEIVDGFSNFIPMIWATNPSSKADDLDVAQEGDDTGESGSNFFSDSIDGFKESLGVFSQEIERQWDAQSESTKTYLTFAAAFLASQFLPIFSERENSARKSEDGSLRANLKFRDQEYDLKVDSDGILSINGQKWKVHGLNAQTKLAKIVIEDLQLDPETETLKVKIKGSLSLIFDSIEKKIEKTLRGDQIKSLLDALTEGKEKISTPEMKANGIELIPI